MNTLNRIKCFVSDNRGSVFLRSELTQFGSPTRTGRALRQRMLDGTMVRLGIGVYAKAMAKASVLTSKPIPIHPLEVLAPEVLNKLGVEVLSSWMARDYNAGRSTQLPAVIVLDIGKRRVARKLSFNGQIVQYERA